MSRTTNISIWYRLTTQFSKCYHATIRNLRIRMRARALSRSFVGSIQLIANTELIRLHLVQFSLQLLSYFSLQKGWIQYSESSIGSWGSENLRLNRMKYRQWLANRWWLAGGLLVACMQLSFSDIDFSVYERSWRLNCTRCRRISSVFAISCVDATKLSAQLKIFCKEENLVAASALDVLRHNFSGVRLKIFKSQLQNRQQQKYHYHFNKEVKLFT